MSLILLHIAIELLRNPVICLNPKGRLVAMVENEELSIIIIGIIRHYKIDSKWMTNYHCDENGRLLAFKTQSP